MAMAMATARITAMFMAITPPQHVEIARTGQAVRDRHHVFELFRKRKGHQLGGPSRGENRVLHRKGAAHNPNHRIVLFCSSVMGL
jgi:hypothetical protein